MPLKDGQLAFLQHQQHVKQPLKVERIVTIIASNLPSLKHEDIKELQWNQPQSDRNLFLMFRDGALSFDQLKVRVNLKHKRPSFKCLGDLIAETLDP